MTTAALTWMRITEAARATGISSSVLRIWESRYGWPTPHRTATGYRCYTSTQIDLIRQVADRVRAGASPAEIIVAGQPRLAPPAPRPVIPTLDLSQTPCPATRRGQEVRDRLICGLVQRHPGIVRWAVAQCALLRPAERGPAVLGILTAYRDQVADHAWLDAALET